MKSKIKKFLTNSKDIEIAENLIDLISKNYKILFIGLVGSHAHGTATLISDVDFKIIYASPLSKFGGVKKELHGVTVVRQEKDKDLLDPAFMKRNAHITFNQFDSKLPILLKEDLVHSIRYERVDKDNLKFDGDGMEIGHFIKQLKKSNSHVLELLHLPDTAVLYTTPEFDLLRNNKQKFVTLQSKYPFLSYTYEQIEKMLNENRKFNLNPDEMKVRKSPLHFIKVYEGKKEKPLLDWLKENKVNQKFCGIVHIPHNHKKMMDFIKFHGEDIDVWYLLSFHLSKQLQLLAAAGHNNNLNNQDKGNYKYTLSYALFHDENAAKRFGKEGLTEDDIQDLKKKYSGTFKGYKGILKEAENGELTSNELRVSAIPKNEKMLIAMTYDKNGYSEYCKVYSDYQKWLVKRNPERHKINIESGQGGDVKNASHSIRIIEIYLEIIKTGKLRVLRPERVQYYIDVKLGKVPIADILTQCEIIQAEIDILFKQNLANLPEKIDFNFIDKILTQIRNESN